MSANVINGAHFSCVGSLRGMGYNLMGGISFIHSTVLVQNSQLEHFISEDAINAYHSHMVVRNSVIEDTYSDAVDVDFSWGILRGNRVRKVGGGWF